jgi:hypothetical protein
MTVNYKKYIPIKDPNEISNIISNNKKSKLELAIFLPCYPIPILNRFVDSDFNKYVPDYIHYIYNNHTYITDLLCDAWIYEEHYSNITIKKVPKIKNIIDNIKESYIISKNINSKTPQFKLAEEFLCLLKNNDPAYSLTYTFRYIKVYWRKDALILDLDFTVAHSWEGASFEFKLFIASQPDLRNYINRLKVEVLKEL